MTTLTPMQHPPVALLADLVAYNGLFIPGFSPRHNQFTLVGTTKKGGLRRAIDRNELQRMIEAGLVEKVPAYHTRPPKFAKPTSHAFVVTVTELGRATIAAGR